MSSTVGAAMAGRWAPTCCSRVLLQARHSPASPAWLARGTVATKPVRRWALVARAQPFHTGRARRRATAHDMTELPQQERESDEVDVCIVGGGPAGLSAAIRLKQLANDAGNEDFRVLLLDKAGEIGAHILSGNVLEPSAIVDLIPEWLSPDNPSRFEHATPATGDKMRFLTKTRAIPLPTPPQMHNHGNYIISLNQFCRWLGERAEEVGVEIYPGFAASEVLYGPDGAVKGVATNDLGVGRDGKAKASFERGMAFHARATLFAEGCHGSLTKQIIRRFDLRRESQHQTYGIGVKEVWEVPAENFRPGEIVHSMGYPLTRDVYGGGWMYHFGNQLVSVGVVVGLDYKNPWLSPYGEFQKMKHHPLYADVLRGGRCLSYGARALNEGGFQSIPKCAFPGGALIGDGAGFLNVPKIKGTHTAMRSGMLAAEAAYAALTSSEQATPSETSSHASSSGVHTSDSSETASSADTPTSLSTTDPENESGADNAGRSSVFLYAYEDALRSSSIWKELREVRNMRPSFHSPLGLYGGILYSGLEAFIFKGRTPWTLRHGVPDYAATQPAASQPQIQYPKPDGELSFDILTSVSRTGTNHEEDQPVHLRVKNWAQHGAKEWPRFQGVENRFCPAAVYEYLDDPAAPDGKRFQINSQNCIHCKTCDIKAPSQDIEWTPPQGGEGPKYQLT